MLARARHSFCFTARESLISASYRGYSLEISKCLPGWRLRIHPTRPELPTLARHTFTVASPRKHEAFTAAHRRIDLLLSYPRRHASPRR
jgi:hypothetical protein